jgi:hypothetical protein
MSALVFDELARLSAGFERFERDCPPEWTACGEWIALREAARAVEDAVAEAWPPTDDEDFDEPEEEPSPEALAFRRMIVDATILADALEASSLHGYAEAARPWIPLPDRFVDAREIGMISEPPGVRLEPSTVVDDSLLGASNCSPPFGFSADGCVVERGGVEGNARLLERGSVWGES